MHLHNQVHTGMHPTDPTCKAVHLSCSAATGLPVSTTSRPSLEKRSSNLMRRSSSALKATGGCTWEGFGAFAACKPCSRDLLVSWLELNAESSLLVWLRLGGGGCDTCLLRCRLAVIAMLHFIHGDFSDPLYAVACFCILTS